MGITFTLLLIKKATRLIFRLSKNRDQQAAEKILEKEIDSRHTG